METAKQRAIGRETSENSEVKDMSDSTGAENSTNDVGADDISSKHYLDQMADHKHLPTHLQQVAADFHRLADKWKALLKPGIERSTMLRHLRDAKDAAVRQKVSDGKDNETPPQ